MKDLRLFMYHLLSIGNNPYFYWLYKRKNYNYGDNNTLLLEEIIKAIEFWILNRNCHLKDKCFILLSLEDENDLINDMFC